MTRAATAKLRVYPALAGLGLIGALALGRPELAALAAPFAVLAGVGLALAQRPELRVHVELDRDRQLEDRTVSLELELAANARVDRLELLLKLPDGLVAEVPNPRVIRLAAGEQRELEVPVRCVHWGTYRVGEVLWRARDTFGLLVFEGSAGEPRPLKVYPSGETLQRLLQPLETQAFSGNQVARHRGEGIEFADLRPFTTGDRVRRVNWRATAKRGVPWVNEAHPERNTDVVLFLDTFAEARRSDTGTLDLGVRAAASFATHYLKEKDRVGLVSFGGVLNWLTAASGTTQLYRIVDSLLDAEILLSYAWKDLDVIPNADPAAARARHRPQPVARRAGRGLAARPAGPRLRPRRDRALAVFLRRGGSNRDRAARLPALASPPRRAPVAVRVARRSDRRMARRGAAGRDGGGGEGIQAPRPSRARLVTGVAALAAAAGLAAYPAVQDIDLRRLALALAGLAVVLLAAGLAARSGPVLGWGLAALGGEYAVLFAAQSHALDELTPLYAGAFFLVAELAFWSIEPRVPAWSEPGLVDRRLAYLAAVSAGAAAVAGLVVIVAAASGGGGAALEAIGVAATIGALGLVAVLVRRSATEVDSGP